MASRRGRRVAVVAALAGVSVLALSGVAFREQVVEWWYRHERIPVVRTWQELLRTEPIDLGGGATARVGMEARRCPAGTGVLLYCVTEGWEPSVDVSWGPWSLGPFVINKTRDGDEVVVQKSAYERQLHSDPDVRRLWFAAAVYVDRPGTIRVELQTREGEPLRTAVVDGTPGRVHGWIPLRPPPAPRPLRRKEMKKIKGIPEVHVSNDWAARALPRWDGAEPFVLETDDPRRGQLPRLLPDAPDPGFRLEAEEGALLVTADEAFSTWDYGRPHLLARWWVNGEPVSGGTESTGLANAREVPMGPILSMKLRLRLDFDPARFGARPGDRIGVEILYCPRGWSSYVGSLEVFPEVPWMPDTDARARMTNRVEFVAR